MNDHEQRREFVEWIINHQKVNAGFSSKIILSDEAHFHLDDFINHQNCHVWSSKNPRVISEKQPTTCDCLVRILAGGIIGPYFFENEAGQAATINGIRYRCNDNTVLSAKIE